MSEMTVQESLAPELRFPKFTENWVERKGEELFVNSRVKGEAGLPIYSVTLNSGLVRRDSLNRKMEDHATDELNLRAQPGDLVYNMMRMWQGAVGLAEVECMVSPAYIVLSGKPGTDTKFFLYNLKRARSLYDLWAYSYGLTEDRLRLYFKDFGKIKFRIPATRAEQKRIANFLRLLDHKKEVLSKKLGLVEIYKHELIKKIFSREVRFKKHNGSNFPDWKHSSIEKLYSWVSTNSLSREKLSPIPGLVQNIHYGDIHKRSSCLFRQNKESTTYIIDIDFVNRISSDSFCQAGDLVIADASEDYKDIGKAIEIVDVSENQLVAGLHTIVARPKCELATGFSAYLFQSEIVREQIRKVAQGVSVLGISKSNLGKLLVQIPVLDEQRKIANFLSSLDKKLEAISKQIELLETFKKGLLQKMFV